MATVQYWALTEFTSILVIEILTCISVAVKIGIFMSKVKKAALSVTVLNKKSPVCVSIDSKANMIIKQELNIQKNKETEHTAEIDRKNARKMSINILR